MTTIELDGGAWRSAAAALTALEGLDETSGDAVWLVTTGTTASFVLSSSEAVVRIEAAGAGAGVAVDGALPLSPRFVWFVAELATSGEPIRIEVVDGVTTVHRAGGLTMAVDVVADAAAPKMPGDEAVAATAVVRAGPLARLLDLVRRAPTGTDLTEPPLPPLWMSIDGKVLSAHADWRERNGGRGTYRLDTGSAAGAATRAVGIGVIARLVAGIAADGGEDDELSLSLPEHAGGWAVLRTPQLTAWAKCRDASVGRWLASVESILDDEEIAYDVLDARTVTFTHAGREVVAELHGGAAETIRLAVVVARDIDDSPEILRELNQANAGLVGIRLWLDRHRVVAGADLPCAHLDDLAGVADSLTRQVSGLDLFLGALSGTR